MNSLLLNSTYVHEPVDLPQPSLEHPSQTVLSLLCSTEQTKFVLKLGMFILALHALQVEGTA